MNYRTKPFTDLIDEDKHGFVKRKYLSTLLGGYRIVISDASETYIGIGLHLGQIVCMFECAIIVLIARFVVEDRMNSMLVGGVLLLVLSMSL